MRTCSQVPRSFSRTTDSAVEIAPVIIPMKPIRPGTRNSALFSSGLNQMRGSAFTGGVSVSPIRSTTRFVETVWTIVIT